ncbi:unnamed protein product [Cylicocyclus nassatus]|uniref:Splicing factor Cactin n=1 Tax=Cylicocyclus nassatus TaxID=53992 RepID=A0AA36MCK6_CYLNA|nr:unnamed protein product [Cylicocyclus nassatus]
MSRHEKKSKHHKRSRSQERSTKKKHHRKHSSSPSSSSSESEHDDKFQSVLDKQRQEKKRLKRLEKEKLKEKETPEEKRARRLAKKLRKEEKKKKENNSYLPPQLAYTNLNNPFNDVNLTETFVWEKKLEVEGKSSYSRKKIEKETRARVERNLREMEELKRTRDARLAAREDMEMMQRDADRKAHAEWTSKEAEFQLQQAKVRSKIRIEQNRAKPIDLLSRYIQFGEEDQDEKDADKDEFELEDPLKYLKGLSQDDYEDLVEDIKVYRSLEKDRHSEFWRDVRCVVDDELRKLRDDRGRLGTSIHGSVQQDVDKIFKGKSVDELCQLERTIVNKVNAGGSGTDISYWEGLLMHLKVYIAKTRLKELHQKMLKLKLARIREEQMREVGKFDLEGRTTVKKRSSSDNEEEDIEKKLRRKIDLDELEAVELDDEQKEMRWKHLTPEQLETATLQLYERGGYSPIYGDLNNAMPGIEILDEDADMKDLLEKRKQHRKVPTGVTKLEAEMLAMARKGMGGDESTFSVEQPLEAQTHLWSDKYRPRKPTYLNRVQTGFDWNKYNQTHYDMDNPPPKIVQGYKFNIFYPDLLDPSQTPSFTVTPCDDPDFAVIKFKAGPPYEDIAFKCVNREWELWFVFKRYRYRR